MQRASAGLRRAVAGVIIGLPLGGQASATPAGDPLDLLEQENRVFAASRYSQTIAETPANVTVITRDDLARFGYRSIHEALASVPGFHDATSQWPGLGVRGLAVPGDFGSRLLFLINGMPIYEPTYGGFFIEYLDIEAIDRIEVVKGTGSALYGSGAVLGIVNLITRSARDAAGSSLALEAASQGTRKLFASHGAYDWDMDSFFAASVTSSPGRDLYLREFDTPEFDNATYGGISSGNDRLRGHRLFGRVVRGDFWLQGAIVDALKGDPLASFQSVFESDLLKLREQLAAFETGFNATLADGAVATGRIYAFGIAERGDYATSDNRLPPEAFINVSDLSSRQVGAELRYDRYVSDRHHVLLGAELKRVVGHQQAGNQPGTERADTLTVNIKPRYTQWAVFLQDEIRLGRHRLFLGARYDGYEGFSQGVKGRLSPRVSYVHEISPKTTGKLIYGEAYRVPTLYETHFQDASPVAASVWANPALKPETARSLEVLAEHRPNPANTWSLSAYYNRLKDSPVQVVTPEVDGYPCESGPEGCTQFRNSGATRSVRGIEAAVRLRPSHPLSLYASLTVQRGNVAGREPASSPRGLAKVGVSHHLPAANLVTALEAWWVGRAQGRLNEDGSRTAAAPGYWLLNANLSTEWRGWRGSLRISNVLDREAYTVASRDLQPIERVPIQPRRISLQLIRSF